MIPQITTFIMHLCWEISADSRRSCIPGARKRQSSRGDAGNVIGRGGDEGPWIDAKPSWRMNWYRSLPSDTTWKWKLGGGVHAKRWAGILSGAVNMTNWPLRAGLCVRMTPVNRCMDTECNIRNTCPYTRYATCCKVSVFHTFSLTHTVSLVDL